jgi:hypothetical protein
LEEVFLRIGKGSDEDDEEEKEELRRFTLAKKEKDVLNHVAKKDAPI